MSAWKEKRRGVSYIMGTRRRQIRVGKPAEPIAVLRLCEDVKRGQEVVLTRRDLLFLADGLDFEARR